MGAGDGEDNAVVVGECALFSHAPGAGGAVGELDGDAVCGDAMGDSAERCQVFQQTAGYVGIYIGSVEGDGLLVSEAGDLQVLDTDGDDGSFIAPAGADGDGDDDDAGAGAVAAAVRTLVGKDDLAEAVRRVGCDGGITNAVVDVQVDAAAVGFDCLAVLRASAVAGSAAEVRGDVQAVVDVIVDGVHFVGYLSDIIGLGLDFGGSGAVGSVAGG